MNSEDFDGFEKNLGSVAYFQRSYELYEFDLDSARKSDRAVVAGCTVADGTVGALVGTVVAESADSAESAAADSVDAVDAADAAEIASTLVGFAAGFFDSFVGDVVAVVAIVGAVVVA